MLTVYELPGCWGLPSLSPFCLKLTTWLRIADLPYRSVAVSSLSQAPKGKAPYIIDGDGTVVGDSTFIIEYLQESRGVDPDRHLSPVERAHSQAFRCMLEDHFVQALNHERWATPEGFAPINRDFFGPLPAFVRALVPRLVQKRVQKNLAAQGILRHKPAEIIHMADADLEALSAFLGTKDFFFERPSTLDAVAFGFLEQLREFPELTPLCRAFRRRQNLVEFCERVRSRFWSKDAEASTIEVGGHP